MWKYFASVYSLTFIIKLIYIENVSIIFFFFNYTTTYFLNLFIMPSEHWLKEVRDLKTRSPNNQAPIKRNQYLFIYLMDFIKSKMK